jgi:arsenate reductase (thioredoxin)
MTGGMAVAARADRAHGPIRVLFVCTGNSVRSIMAEVMLRHHGGPAFEAASAGTFPSGIHPLTRRVIEEAGLPTDGLRSKSVSEYLGQPFDYVVTLCDDARLVCPTFPGVHETLHWGYDDPSAVQGPDAQRLAAFRRTFGLIGERTSQFVTVVGRKR